MAEDNIADKEESSDPEARDVVFRPRIPLLRSGVSTQSQYPSPLRSGKVKGPQQQENVSVMDGNKDILFRAWNVRHFVEKWEEITSDNKILTMIREGVRIDFVEEPAQCTEPKPIQFSGKEQEWLMRRVINSCTKKSLWSVIQSLGTISLFSLHQKEMVPKASFWTWKGSMNWLHITISKWIPYSHVLVWRRKAVTWVQLTYGMPTIPPLLLNLIKNTWNSDGVDNCKSTPACQMDWHVHATGVHYDHESNSFLICENKALYPVVIWMTFSCLETRVLCANNVMVTKEFLSGLGFVVHPVKPNFMPTQILGHLGFVLDSRDMTVTISEEKHTVLIALAKDIIVQSLSCIGDVVRLVGILVANIPTAEFGNCL